MKKEILPEVLAGRKRIALAITEAFAGSDVAGLRTTAEKSPCGKFYIVNGTKKWISSGTFADYFVTAVRTGGEGAAGVSMLLIPRVEVRALTMTTITIQPTRCPKYSSYPDHLFFPPSQASFPKGNDTM